MANVQFRKAERRKVYSKTLVSGPSGSGKSYSALRIATGIARKCNSRIAYIGTEGSRDEYYCTVDDGIDGLFDYDLISLEAPFTIDKYIEAIDAAIDGGYQVLIIDTLSAEWKWLNDTHDAMPGNSWQNWSKLKPRHRAFMDKILLSPIHVVATARTKTDWVIEEKNGKQNPKKVGLAAVQDSEISYEYTISFQIDQDSHIAVADKDNTMLFNNRYEVLTEKDGEAIWEWCNRGNLPAVTKTATQTTAAPEIDNVSNLQNQIITRCKELGGTKNETLMATLKEFSPNGNPKTIKDEDMLVACLDAINSLN